MFISELFEWYSSSLQFGFEASSSELRLKLDRAETELSVEEEKCFMLRKELLATNDRSDKTIELAELQVTFVYTLCLKKMSHLVLAISLLIINQFSNFFSLAHFLYNWQ